MGIPRFFKFLSINYPDLIFSAIPTDENREYCEGLYIDLNTPIHTICQYVFKYGLERELTADDEMLRNFFRSKIAEGKIKEVQDLVFEMIGQYLIHSYLTYRPLKVLMFAIDGVAPAAKMTQQRSRRFKSTGPPVDFFDPTMISPGTPFMDALDNYLTKLWPEKYKAYFGEGLQVIYSSHREAGEGEHKMFDQLNSPLEEVKGQIRPKTGGRSPYQIVLGADSDLIVLSMSKERRIIFVRDPILVGKQKQLRKKQMSPLETIIHGYLIPRCQGAGIPEPAAAWKQFFTNGYIFVDIPQMRDRIGSEYVYPHDMMDFTFISFLVGNDFLPAVPEVEIVVSEAPYRLDNFAVRDHVKEIRFLEERRRGTPAGKVPRFDEPAFVKEFDAKAPKWNRGGKPPLNTQINYGVDLKDTFWNSIDNRHEIYPLQQDALTGDLYRIILVKGPRNDRWQELRSDMGGLKICLQLYGKMLKEAGAAGSRGKGQDFIVEKKSHLNYVNLLKYLKQLQINILQFINSHVRNEEAIERSEEGTPNPIVQMAISVKDGKKSLVPASFLGAYRRLAFGIYDSAYADPELPKKTTEDMCRKWLEGAQWILRYYTAGFRAINTRWFYPYDRSPTIDDLVSYLEARMQSHVEEFPGINISPYEETVEVKRYRIEGVVVNGDDGLPSINRMFNGALFVYHDELAQTIAQFKHITGAEKYVDFKMLNFVREPRALLYGGRPEETAATTFTGLDPAKLNFVSEGAEVLTYEVKKRFLLTEEIYRVVTNVASPYASTVESFFSIMPERVLKLILSPELVDLVLRQITDYFPLTVEIIADGKFSEGEAIARLPKVSPIRIQRAVDLAPAKFDLEIVRFNARKPRYQLILGTPVTLKEVKSRGRGVGERQGTKMFGADEANIQKRTAKRQTTGGKVKKAQAETMEAVSGGYGTSLGGILPQWTEYFAQLKNTRTGPEQVTKQPLVNDAERAEIAKFPSTVVFKIPSPVPPPSDLGVNYVNLPSTLPYRDDPLQETKQQRKRLADEKDDTLSLAAAERSKLVNEIYFLNIFGKLAPHVVVCGMQNKVVSRWIILAKLFPAIKFDIWEPRPGITDFTTSRNVTIFRRFLLGETAGTGEYSVIDPKVFEYRKKPILLVTDMSWLPQRPAGEGKNLGEYAVVAQRLVSILQPLAALGKLRLPTLQESQYPFMDGIVWLEPWGLGRAETTRLVVYGQTSYSDLPLTAENIKSWWGFVAPAGMDLPVLFGGTTFKIPKIKAYDLAEHQNKLYYYNLIVRNRLVVTNSLNLTTLNLPSLLNTMDYGLEIAAWHQWLTLNKPELELAAQQKMAATLMERVGRVLGYSLDGNYVEGDKDAILYIQGLVNQEFAAKLDRPIMVTYADIKERLKYDWRTNLKDCNHHDGQRKLLLSEVQFLTRNRGKIVVYAGAAPSIKGAFLASLFPDRVFVLVDPNPFQIAPYGGVLVSAIGNVQEANLQRPGVYTLNALMTIEIAQYFATVGEDVLFISDIRTAIERNDDTPTTTDIVWNTAQMYNWIKTMKPKVALLKFRLPYDGKGKDDTKMVKTDLDKAKELGLDLYPLLTGGRLLYPQGTIFLQAWAPPQSTETRLEIRRENLDNLVEYPSLTDYENALFHFNVVQRCELRFVQDRGLEILIWKEYLNYAKDNRKVEDLQLQASRVIGKESK